MTDLSIDVRLPEVHDRLNKLGRDQIPFATALALTWTANDARDDVRRGLPDRFEIRSNWLERGIQTKPASKRNLQATVLSRDEFMVRQEYGGTKSPRKKFTALPRQIRSNPKQLITRAKRPGRILKKANVFIADLPGRTDIAGIFQKIGRKGMRRLLYVLDPRPMDVKPRFGFSKTVDGTVAKRFGKNFGKALARAISSAK